MNDCLRYLGSKSLSGTIPESIGYLTYMEKLYNIEHIKHIINS